MIIWLARQLGGSSPLSRLQGDFHMFDLVVVFFLFSFVCWIALVGYDRIAGWTQRERWGLQA